MLYILAFTHIFLSFNVLRGIWRCSFRTDRAMRRPTNRGTSDRLAPRSFILYISQ